MFIKLSQSKQEELREYTPKLSTADLKVSPNQANNMKQSFKKYRDFFESEGIYSESQIEEMTRREAEETLRKLNEQMRKNWN